VLFAGRFRVELQRLGEQRSQLGESAPPAAAARVVFGVCSTSSWKATNSPRRYGPAVFCPRSSGNLYVAERDVPECCLEILHVEQRQRLNGRLAQCRRQRGIDATPQ
jgi:hypothetical protein